MPQETTKLVDEEGQTVDEPEVREEPSLGMWISVIPTLCAPILFGYAMGYTSPTFLPDDTIADKDYFDVAMAMTEDQKTWIGSLPNFGAAAGALLGGIPVDKYGKKAGMCMSNLMFAIGFVLLITTPVVVPYHSDANATADTASHDNTKSIVQLYFSRLIMGAGMGLSCVATPAYQTEISPLKLRGLLGSFFQVGVVLGFVLAYSVGFAITWKPMAILALCISCVGLVLCALIPESPQWLVNKGDNDKALTLLRKLRTEDTDFQALLSSLTIVKTASELELEERGDKFGELMKFPRNKALAIGVGLMFMQQLTGINAVMGYASNIFGYAISDDETDKAKWSNIYALLGQIVQLVVTLIAARFSTRLNRKLMLTIAAGGLILSTIIMEVYFFSHSHTVEGADGSNKEEKSVSGTVAVVGLMLYISSFACGMGAIPWLMLGELFHPGIRGTAAAICTAVNWMLSFAVMKTVKVLQNGFGGGETGMGWVFFLYASVVVVGMVCVNIFVPETRGKSYQAVDRELRGKGNRGYGAVGNGEF